VEEFPLSKIIDGTTVFELSDRVKAAYEAPYPDKSYKTGARQFTLLVRCKAGGSAAAANGTAWQVLP
jgi:haloalkane dehalogenase